MFQGKQSASLLKVKTFMMAQPHLSVPLYVTSEQSCVMCMHISWALDQKYQNVESFMLSTDKCVYCKSPTGRLPVSSQRT